MECLRSSSMVASSAVSGKHDWILTAVLLESPVTISDVDTQSWHELPLVAQIMRNSPTTFPGDVNRLSRPLGALPMQMN